MTDFNKTAEQLLEDLSELRQQYDDLLYYLPDALLEVDIISPRLLYMNQMAYSLFGYTKNDLAQGIDLPNLFAENEFKHAKEIVDSYVAQSHKIKEPYIRATKQLIYEFLMKKKDGTRFHAETQTSFVLDKNQIPIAMRSIIRDVTDRKLAEEERIRAKAAVAQANGFKAINKKLENEIAERKRVESVLRESEKRFRELYENIPSMYFTLDANGMIISVNKFGANQLGYNADELVDQSILNYLYDDDKEAFLKQIQTCVKNPGKVFQWQFRKIHKDSHLIWVREVARAVRGTNGKIVILIVCEDINETKRVEEEQNKLERQLQHAQKLESLSYLAGGIAHDFNNLLTGILGNASLALMDLPQDSPARESLKLVESATLSAAELTNQLLAYAGKGRYVVERLDLSKLVKEMSQLLKSVISKNVTIRFNLADNLPAVEADSTQIRQIVLNLITNASEAIGEKSDIITVTTGTTNIEEPVHTDEYFNQQLSKGLYVFIEVADNGPGMDAETQSKIFDPFFSTKFTGRGLGLAAVMGIVRGHKGAINLISAPGQGTKVKVLLPSSPKSEKLKDQKSVYQKIDRGSGVILVVDDEEVARTVAQKVLEKVGFTVLCAKDGQEGVDVFLNNLNKIKAILLDLTMPKMSGEKVLSEFHRSRPDVPVILTSGYNEPHTVTRFAGKNLAGFIQKPYQPEFLIAKINEVLQREE